MILLLPGAFVSPAGAAAPRTAAATEGGLRAPAVAMESRGGAQEPAKSDLDLPQILTVLFFFSLAANVNGFFNGN